MTARWMMFTVLALLLINFSRTSEEQYFITPSLDLNDLCPTEACLTFDQFASNSTNYLERNITLFFLEGNHSFASELSIENMTTFIMQSNSINEVKVVCNNSSAQMKIMRVSKVHIKGIHFIGCVGNTIEAVEEFILKDSSFIGQRNINGTALELVETSSMFISSTLSLNSAGNKVQPIRCKPNIMSSHPYSTNEDSIIYGNIGGAVIATKSNVTIVNSMFDGNRAQAGGAIYARLRSNITIINSTIEGNRAHFVGGAIFAELQNNITIINSQFTENHVTQFNITGECHHSGAALYLHHGCHARIKKSSFKYNSAIWSGVAVVCGDNTVLDINESEFAENIKTHHQKLHGAVIDLSRTNNVRLTIFGSDFHDNDGEYGGAISAAYSTAVYITISNSSFINNKAAQGGVLNIRFSRDMNISIAHSEFIKNTAISKSYCGGVIYALHIQDTYIGIINSHLKNNSAERNGGVIMMDGVSSSLIVLKSNNLSNNKAANLGGVMAIRGVSYYSHDLLIIINDTIFTKNTATKGGVIGSYSNHHIGNIMITGSTFQNNSAYGDGGVILMSVHGTVEIVASNFTNNRANRNGGAVNTLGGITVIRDSQFFHNSANLGGAIWSEYGKIRVYGSSLSDNSADIDGGTLYTHETSINIIGGKFSHNAADNNGGVMYTHGGMITINDTEFHENSAGNDGGIMRSYLSKVNIHQSRFITNWAERQGGAFFQDQSNLRIEESALMDNKAHTGGIFLVEQGTLTIIQSYVFNNTAHTGGVMKINQATLNIDTTRMTHNRGIVSTMFLMESTALWSNSLFSNNEGTVLAFGSSATISYCVLSQNKQPTQWTEVQKLLELQGGAITAFQSELTFNGTCELRNNEAEHGGAIKALESKVQVYGNVIFESNKASKTGGGIYLFFSELTCWNNSTMSLISNGASSRGGGIHAIASSIKVKESSTKEHSTLHFVENAAERGGGLYIKKNSKLYIIKSRPEVAIHSKSVTFTGNSAQYGGAIYASDDGMCSLSKNSTKDECFFQTLAMYSVMASDPGSYQIPYQDIFFFNNTAEVSGHSLFGGSLNSCKVNPFSDPNVDIEYKDDDNVILTKNGHEYIHEVSNIQDSDISSHPVRVCFCRNGNPDCTYQPDPIHIRKGKEKKLVLSVAIVDQISHPIKEAGLYSHLGSGNDVCQNHIQKTDGNCNQVSFTVFSNNNTEDLILSLGEGPCKQSEESKVRVALEFSCLECPIGFELDITREGCQCVCDSQLFPFFTNCSGDVLVRERNVWIANFAKSITENTSNNNNQYLIHPFCPLNYCHPPSSRVLLNLNTPNGINAQCADNRSGLLCGTCLPGLSLSLGSSRCLTCSDHWLAILIVILIAAFLAGILLVVALLVLNLTVAAGTLNGIIFYANIVAANSSIYLPSSCPNFITVFLSWLNLEIGFDTCFFEGMDAYWKTLIQLVFPSYVILLVIVIIIICETSSRFAKLIGKRNPVATLATLILLCYAKLLHTIIASLSFAVLRYPDGFQQTVWLPDATVPYLKEKHIALFGIAVLILIVGVAFTALLLSWQWLLRLQKVKALKWMNHQKLCHFIEPYHAPYTFKYRYWTGLLLLVRVVLYMVSAVNVEGDPRVTLVANIFVIGSLLLVKGVVQKWIYKKWPVDILETIMYFNILAFSAFTWYTLDSDKSQAAVACTSVMITFFLLLSVVAFHVYKYTTLGTFIMHNEIFKLISTKVKVMKRSDLHAGIPQVNKIKHNEEEQNRPTYSVVEIHKPQLIHPSRDEEDVTY